MIYSFTMFYNEIDLLDMKISEEINCVDQIVVTESNQTHSGRKKPLLLKDNPKYNDSKIKLVFLEDQFSEVLPEDSYEIAAKKRMGNCVKQREAGINTVEIKDDDIIFSSDLDEILIGKDFPMMIEETRKTAEEHWGPNNYIKGRHCRLAIWNHVYKLNLVRDYKEDNGQSWAGPVSITGNLFHDLPRRFERKGIKAFFKISLHGLRNSPFGKVVKTNGHHFSYLMDPEGIVQKRKDFSDAWEDTPEKTDIDKITEDMQNLVYNGLPLTKICMDNTYPMLIWEDFKTWNKHILTTDKDEK